MGVAALQVEQLTKRYGQVLALDAVSFYVTEGEVFGFLGPNGAGKSTTIRMLLGLARPTAGRAWIFGRSVWDVAAAHRMVGYVPADVALWPQLTGAEHLELFARTRESVDRRYQDQLVERLDLDPSQPARTYSTGNRQKVALIAAFATRAPLLVLDEPTSGLDPLVEREFRLLVRDAQADGQAVFLSSHQLSEVEAVCDRVGILRRGQLVEVATMAGLRGLHRTEVSVTFAGAAPDLTGVAGVEAVHLTGGRSLRFSLRGSPAAALAALLPSEVTSIAVREPSLDEMFLTYYGPDAR